MIRCVTILGNEFRHNNTVLQFFTPTLNWLNCDDRVGILRTHDGSCKIFINSEELSVSFPNSLPDELYAVFELRGQCNEIAVTSHKTPYSPLTSVRLQDSLELVLNQQEQSTASNTVEIKDCNTIETKLLLKTLYEFHDNHGRNIELVSKNVARRVASYNQGIVIIQPAIEINRKVEIIVEQIDSKWLASLTVGLICGPLDRLNLPLNGLSMKAPCCIVANDWISINGIKVINCNLI